ncbi:MAG: hypothetical protein COA78_22745 [Blastopirellula sp.]|nr:MAG: hypothetical protein COA78_22745 [Blastopirellula sp.]
MATITAGSYIAQLMSNQPTGFIISNEISSGDNIIRIEGRPDLYRIKGEPDTYVRVGLSDDNIRHIEGNEKSYVLRDFQGVVLSVQKLGMPEVGLREEDSGQRLRITINSLDGTIYIIDDFHSGRHAEAEIETMVGQEFSFPYKLWLVRVFLGYD